MKALVRRSTAEERFRTLIVTIFGVAAALLSAVGIFGVTARSVTYRTRELGIRMALGARKGSLVRDAVAMNGLPLAAGLIIGLTLSLALASNLSGYLFGVESRDPVAFGGALILLAGVCLVASYIPARRVTKLHPVEVLKT